MPGYRLASLFSLDSGLLDSSGILNSEPSRGTQYPEASLVETHVLPDRPYLHAKKAKHHVDSAPRRPTFLFPQICSWTPFFSLSSRFSAAMKLSRLVPRKVGEGSRCCRGGKISLKHGLRQDWNGWNEKNQGCSIIVSAGPALGASRDFLVLSFYERSPY
jgi:hypothetical protein